MVCFLTAPVRTSRPSEKPEPSHTSPSMTNTSDGERKPAGHGHSHSFFPVSAASVVRRPPLAHSTTPSLTTSVAMDQPRLRLPRPLRLRPFFLLPASSAFGLACESSPDRHCSFPLARSRHTTPLPAWKKARLPAAARVRGIRWTSSGSVQRHSVSPVSARRAAMAFWFGKGIFGGAVGPMPACSAAGAPTMASRTPSWTTASSALSVASYVRTVSPVAASSADTGAPSPSGTNTRPPTATRALGSCTGPERKPLRCQAHVSMGRFQSSMPLKASRPTTDQSPAMFMSAPVASSTI